MFVDIRPDTMNIDETLIEAAVTERTKAIVPVHYAGVACEMDTICSIARKYNLLVVEDAAQGMMATYKGQALGTLGDYGGYSFHETKNYSMGEAGSSYLPSNINVAYLWAQLKQATGIYDNRMTSWNLYYELLKEMHEQGITDIPLHSSPAGQQLGEFHGEDRYTTKESERLLRLPLYYGL